MPRIALVVAVVVIILLVVASVAGYFFYLQPRLEVKSFTEKLASQVARDVELSNELSDFFEELDSSGSEDFSPDQFRKEAAAVREELKAAQAEYEDILRQMESLEASERTEGLKQGFVALNRFYVEQIPALLEMVDYFEQMVVSIDRFEAATRAIEGSSGGDSLEQITADINSMNGALKTTIDDLKRLQPPEVIADFHQNLVAAMTETSVLLDETLLAISTLDVNRLTELETRYAMLEEKYGDALNVDDEQFDMMLDEISETEDEVLENARQEVDSIRDRYGQRWVSGELRFELDDGWSTERGRSSTF